MLTSAVLQVVRVWKITSHGVVYSHRNNNVELIRSVPTTITTLTERMKSCNDLKKYYDILLY